MEGSQQWPQHLDPCHSCEVPEWSSRLWASTWSIPGCCNLLENKSAEKRSLLSPISPPSMPSLCVCVCVWLFLCYWVFQISKSWENKETKHIQSLWNYFISPEKPASQQSSYYSPWHVLASFINIHQIFLMSKSLTLSGKSHLASAGCCSCSVLCSVCSSQHLHPCIFGDQSFPPQGSHHISFLLKSS